MPTMAGQAATALLDSDEDGLSDAWESSLGTNPLHKDSDGDGFGGALERPGRRPASSPTKTTTTTSSTPDHDLAAPHVAMST